MEVIKRDGSKEPLCPEKIEKCVRWACAGLDVNPQLVIDNSGIAFYDGVSTQQMQDLLIKAAAEAVTVNNPDYTFVAARLLMQRTYKEATGGEVSYRPLREYIEEGVAQGALNYDLLSFDLEAIDKAIDPDRDMLFDYRGMQTVYDRYLIRREGKRGSKGTVMEMPQHFWMRVALGLALNEHESARTFWAIQFYDVLSQFEFVSSTPTLFNSGTNHSQMSSCYLNTVDDSIEGIYGTITECAHLSKWAGGIGTDWTRVRPSGDLIQGTRGKSSGVVPYLKVFNDTAVAVNQGGKRNGAFAAYLEPWHADVEAFIDLKKNAGDDRMRAREIFPALWMNDLFMERLEAGGEWSLFSSAEYPELHELYGDEFKAAYEAAEAEGGAVRKVDANTLWRKIITSLAESGAPWITFKDECNRRSPQDHVGTVHNSNLCTEITLNTSDDETAVCNLGSVNVGRIGPAQLRRVITVAVRMLDNVIDLNFYPSEKARYSNMRHRPIGLGLMGWNEYVARMGVDWESEEHLRLTDEFFEQWSYWAISASCDLAADRGTYESYDGSKWDRGLLPIDTARKLPAAWSGRGGRVDWDGLRERIKRHGMRNSNVMAIAPTATISHITGCSPCIEPAFERVGNFEQTSGLFKVLDPTFKYLSADQIKTVFEIDQKWLIRAAAVRQKWIDQAQSLNLFAKFGTLGRELDDWYRTAWRLGVKTTYYLRNQINDVDHKVIGEIKPVVEVMAPAGLAASDYRVKVDEQGVAPVTVSVVNNSSEPLDALVCSIENGPDCTSCQ